MAYDTRYGTTKTIGHWLSEGIAGNCIKRMSDVASLDYDLIVGGLPVYTDELLPGMTQFLYDNREALS